MGAKLTNVALVTDGRYSGASHGFIVGHVVPEAAVGGPIAVVQDGDIVTIDAETHSISMDVSDDEIAQRMKSWKAPKPTVTRGVLAKYAALVGDASHGEFLLTVPFVVPVLIGCSRRHDRSVLISSRFDRVDECYYLVSYLYSTLHVVTSI